MQFILYICDVLVRMVIIIKKLSRMRRIFVLSVFTTMLLCGCSSDTEEVHASPEPMTRAVKTAQVVLTDPDGNKLINYTAIIPVMIQAIKDLKAEVETLKSGK